MTGLDTLLVLIGAGTVTATLMRAVFWLDGGHYDRQKTARRAAR